MVYHQNLFRAAHRFLHNARIIHVRRIQQDHAGLFGKPPVLFVIPLLHHALGIHELKNFRRRACVDNAEFFSMLPQYAGHYLLCAQAVRVGRVMGGENNSIMPLNKLYQWSSMQTHNSMIPCK